MNKLSLKRVTIRVVLAAWAVAGVACGASRAMTDEEILQSTEYGRRLMMCEASTEMVQAPMKCAVYLACRDQMAKDFGKPHNLKCEPYILPDEDASAKDAGGER